MDEQIQQLIKPIEPIKKQKPKWLVLFVIIAGIIVLGLIGWEVYYCWFKFTPVEGWPKEKGSELTPWKTYRNEEYGFEVKYPGNWELGYTSKSWREPEKEMYFLEKEYEVWPGSFEINIFLNPEKLSIKEWWKLQTAESEKEKLNCQQQTQPDTMCLSRKDLLTLKEEQLNFKGIPAQKIWENAFNYAIECIQVTEKTYVYELCYEAEENSPDPNYEEHRKIYNQILSTFKFIDTSSWKTYRNEEYGFEFKYPESFYLLDRLEQKENAVLVSDEKIEFNEHLDGYFAPISFYPTDNARDKIYIDSLSEKETREITVNDIGAKFIKGVVPEQLPYHGFNRIVIIFEKPKITLIASDVRTFAGGKVTFDLEITIDQILSTFKFIEPEKDEFCGWSTNGQCSSDSDCIIGGCSGQVCQSKNEEPITTTCEWSDCYNAKVYGVGCKCLNNKCQWNNAQWFLE
jgi:eight-cysteine-cluster-containing protein